MTRGVWSYLVGSLVLVGLASCGRFLAEREPWRHEAEVACLKSGAVKEGPAVSLLRPIDGPGICGADFPLRVAALGEGSAAAYADELRPPAAIPNVPPPRATPPYSAPPGPPYGAPPAAEPGAPMSLRAPGMPPIEADPVYAPPSGAPVSAYPQPAAPRPYPEQAYPQQGPYAPASPPEPLPRLGPARVPAMSYAQVAANVQPPATLTCPLVSALDQWVASAVQPAAARWFGQPVTEIKQISAYSCRGMNGNPNARISEHAFGNALDIAAFTLADGRRITVKEGWRGSPEEQGFLHDVQLAACDQFTTVLAPGSNSYHYDHMHVDLMRRESGRHVCQPTAISGEIAAARAAQRNPYAHRGDPLVTGSIGTASSARRVTGHTLGYADDERRGGFRTLPPAIPGED